jgi:hypothetical protein
MNAAGLMEKLTATVGKWILTGGIFLKAFVDQSLIKLVHGITVTIVGFANGGTLIPCVW